MRTNNRVAVGSPTARVAAVMAATLLAVLMLAGAGIAGSRLLAADGPIVVDQSGAGDHTTIAEAVAAAATGDKILIRPGRYVESVLIDSKDLTISGDGERDGIIVEAAPAPDPYDPEAQDNLAFHLLDSDTTISNLTIIGQEEGTAVYVMGTSSSTIDGVAIRLLGEWTGDHTPIGWDTNASGVVTNSILEGYIGGFSTVGVTLQDNELPATCIILQDPGVRATIVNNTIHGCPYEFAIELNSGTATIEDNDIWIEEAAPGHHNAYSRGRLAISLSSADAGTVVRNNDIHDSISGVVVSSFGAGSTIEGNRLTNNDTGIIVSGDATLTGNTVTGSRLAIALGTGAQVLEDNVVTANDTGLRLSKLSSPTLMRNTFCDNGTNVELAQDAIMPDTAGNTVCEDAPAE